MPFQNSQKQNAWPLRYLSIDNHLKKHSALSGRSSQPQLMERRLKAIELIIKAHAPGAGLVSACREIGISLRTLKRRRHVFHRLTAEER